MSNKLMNTLTAAAVAAALAIGAYLLGTSQSGDTATASNAAAQQPPGAAQQPSGNAAQPPSGMRGGPGMGTPVSGATADKVAKAALAKHPGTIEHVEQLADGSYVAHVLTTGGGELHVAVSKAFKVTGIQQRPHGPQGSLPQGAKPPAAATS
jgi:hypothetical protein